MHTTKRTPTIPPYKSPPNPTATADGPLLALDPILAETGFALLDPHTRQILTKGTIPTKHTADQDWLIVIATHITMLLEQHRPAEIAIERLFVGLNRSTALTLGAVRNLLLYLAAFHRIPITEYIPSTVKATVTGNGSATRLQVSRMIHCLTCLRTSKHNESDAIAVGLTHLRHRDRQHALSNSPQG